MTPSNDWSALATRLDGALGLAAPPIAITFGAEAPADVVPQIPVTEMTCAIPASKLGEVLDALGATTEADGKVARYAGTDARRFADG